jgi:hypothetical protein
MLKYLMVTIDCLNQVIDIVQVLDGRLIIINLLP